MPRGAAFSNGPMKILERGRIVVFVVVVVEAKQKVCDDGFVGHGHVDPVVVALLRNHQLQIDRERERVSVGGEE